MSQIYNVVLKEPNIRKGKVEIKKVEEKRKRYVTFSKHKQGLFIKVTELSLLCQAETALVINSQKGKLYACGYPDPDSVMHRYQGGDGGGYHNRAAKTRFQQGVETLRLKFDATEEKLKEENMHHEKITEGKKNGLVFTEWRDLSIEDMGFEQVEEFKNCLEDLKKKLVAAREKKKKKVNNSLPPLPVAHLPLPVASSPMQRLSDVSFLNEGFKVYGVWNSGVSSMVPGGGFHHY
ncbi:MADS-box protein AGL71-like [Gastrolobium bilobum]|uniref:MADS-box protein AGL71-like n=1 Tax=Gastrolobium bilobum TaxID=150636 RepID=UPI002AAF20FF|nr:MADS-box protein AGL71-like [Gastrolobium bilobum]